MKKTLVTALLTLFLVAPILAQTVGEHPQDVGQRVAEHHADPAITSWKKSIQLDNGKKWPANAATKQGMDSMLAAVTKASGQKPAPDAKALQTELKQMLKTVFQKCDMTGPAHDNLHIYLIPLIEKVDNLGEQTSPAAVKDSVVQIKAQLLEFGNYFQ